MKTEPSAYVMVSVGPLCVTLAIGGGVGTESLALADALGAAPRSASTLPTVAAVARDILAPFFTRNPVWGMKVTVPQAQAGESDADALSRLAETQAAAAAAASQTTVTWDTFIPQAKIDAPPAGCTYSGSGYQYGGDNRSYDWTSSRYRTALNAVITWSTKQVDGYKAVGSTSVYNKSTGALVATKTASTSNMEARKLGSGSNYVDIRLVNHASNPFCSVGAIDGAISMKVTQGGNWSIISGNHRQMPNHHIYIYNGGTVTDVYRRNYANALCLIGSATCPLADLTGYSGSYS